MALSLTTAVKDKVAKRIYGGTTYAALGTQEQGMIDDEGASALTLLQQYGQWFDLSTPAAPDAWEPWFISEISLRIAQSSHPLRVQQATRQRDSDRNDAMSTYGRVAVTYDPASTTDAFVYTVQNVRKYVISNAARRRPPFMVSADLVDSALDEVLNDLWNRSHHVYRKRSVELTITPIEVTDATYTEPASIYTLTKTSAFTNYTHAGQTRLYVTGGADVTPMEMIIASRISGNAITLVNSLGSAVAGDADVDGVILSVSMNGLEAWETFDSIASVELRHANAGSEQTPLRWVSPEEMMARRISDGMSRGTPLWFRTNQAGSAVGWEFSPVPDAAYVLRGYVLTRQPADPVSASDTLPFSRFAAEHVPLIRRMTLARTLTNAGRHDDVLTKECNDEATSTWPIMESPGDVDIRRTVTDVYGDVRRLSDRDDVLGGAL